MAELDKDSFEDAFGFKVSVEFPEDTKKTAADTFKS